MQSSFLKMLVQVNGFSRDVDSHGCRRAKELEFNEFGVSETGDRLTES